MNFLNASMNGKIHGLHKRVETYFNFSCVQFSYSLDCIIMIRTTLPLLKRLSFATFAFFVIVYKQFKKASATIPSSHKSPQM